MLDRVFSLYFKHLITVQIFHLKNSPVSKFYLKCGCIKIETWSPKDTAEVRSKAAAEDGEDEPESGAFESLSRAENEAEAGT
jgi:hypothetical protein